MQTLLNAILYYSRIPVPFKVECSPEILSRALRYLPLVGILVGVIGWGAFWVASNFLSHNIAVVVAMVAMVLSTGALHEDGFADFCDGFGGGYGCEAILRIMKDSYIGCYGVIALILVFLLRYSLLCSFGVAEIGFVFVGAQAASRFFPVLMVRTSRYVREEGAKSAQSSLGITIGGVVVAMIFAFAPLSLLGWHFAAVCIPIMCVVFMLFRSYLHRHIGGFTGDTLGALQIIGEMVFYITLLAKL